jgi:transcriptional regulator with XRE-family HTH domain
MTVLSELARKRLVQWMEKNPAISQTEVGRAVGHGQGWVSKYKRGEQDADIDELDGMARVFGHTLTELLDLRDDDQERDLLDAFRALRPELRPLAIATVKAMAPAPPKTRRSSRTR